MTLQTVALSAFGAVLALAGLRYRSAAAAGVASFAAALVTSGEAHVLAYTIAGIAATAYLMLVHGVGGEQRRLTRNDALVLAITCAFTVITCLAFFIPVHLRWLPVITPIAVLVLVALPLLGAEAKSEE